MSRGTIHPVHNALTAPISVTTFANPKNFYQSTKRAYLQLQTQQTSDFIASPGFINPKQSSWGTLLSESITVTEASPSEDGLPLGDSVDQIDFTVTADEGLPLGDSVFTDPVLVDDGIPLGDSVVSEVQSTEDNDAIDLGDSASPTGYVKDDSSGLPLGDESSFTATLKDDTSGLPLSDSALASFIITGDDGLPLSDSVHQIVDETAAGSCCIQIDYPVTEAGSCNITVLEYDMADVVSLTSPSNPFAPTVIINGGTVVSNPSTLPPVIPSNYNGIRIADPGLGNESICNLFQYSVNLTLGGGTFSFLSKNQIGQIGQVLSIFGIQGVITKEGPHVSASGVGRICSGIFGNRAMNQQLLLVMDQTNVSGLVPNIILQQPPSIEWSTLSAAALDIARASGVGVQWAAKDAPLTDMFAQTGMKVIDAIRSLASRVNAIVVYNGKGGYVVTDPTHGYGPTFTLPECNLVGLGGFEVASLLDMDNQILVFPIEPANGSTVQLGQIASRDLSKSATQIFSTTPAKVERIGEARTVIQTGQPDSRFPLPGAYDQVVCHVVVTDESLVGGIVTTDPNQWFGPSVGSPLTIETDPSGKQNVVLTSADFPSQIANADPNSFTFEIGYTRNTAAMDTAYDNAFQERLQQQRMLVEAQQQSIVFFRAYEGSLNTAFFGQIPQPGNPASISYNGASINGMVESVSISYPGNIAIQIGSYVEQNFLTPRARLDWFNATNNPTPPGIY